MFGAKSWKDGLLIEKMISNVSKYPAILSKANACNCLISR